MDADGGGGMGSRAARSAYSGGGARDVIGGAGVPMGAYPVGVVPRCCSVPAKNGGGRDGMAEMDLGRVRASKIHGCPDWRHPRQGTCEGPSHFILQKSATARHDTRRGVDHATHFCRRHRVHAIMLLGALPDVSRVNTMSLSPSCRLTSETGDLASIERLETWSRDQLAVHGAEDGPARADAAETDDVGPPSGEGPGMAERDAG